MPIIKSAKKRVRVAAKASVRNAKTKRSLRGALKVFSTKPTSANQSKAQSALDKAVKKGIVHKNKAARQKKRLAAQAKAAGVKVTKRSPVVTKSTARKTAVPKKPAAKKK